MHIAFGGAVHMLPGVRQRGPGSAAVPVINYRPNRPQYRRQIDPELATITPGPADKTGHRSI